MAEIINFKKCKDINSEMLDIAHNQLFALCPPENIPQEQMSGLLKKVRILASWIEEVEKYALGQALEKGVKYDGFTLKEGRTTPKFKDEKEVIDLLFKAGYKCTETKIMSVAAIKKMIGEAKFDELLSDKLLSKTGKMALVAE